MSLLFHVLFVLVQNLSWRLRRLVCFKLLKVGRSLLLLVVDLRHLNLLLSRLHHFQTILRQFSRSQVGVIPMNSTRIQRLLLLELLFLLCRFEFLKMRLRILSHWFRNISSPISIKNDKIIVLRHILMQAVMFT